MPFWTFPQWLLLLSGFMGILAAIALWYRVRNAPEDIPVYSLEGIGKSTKKEVHNAAIGLVIGGIFLILIALEM